MSASPSRIVFFVVTLSAFALLIVAPLGTALVRSFLTDAGLGVDAYSAVLGDERQWELLANSMLLVLTTTLFAASIGVPAGLSTAFFLDRMRPWINGVFLVTLIAPSYVFAVAWVDLLGQQGAVSRTAAALFGWESARLTPYGLWGTAWVLGLSYFPVMAFATSIGVGRIDREVLESLRLAAGVGPRFLWTVLGLSKSAIAAGALGVAFLTLTNFSVPSLLQFHTYPLEIYTSFNAFNDPPRAIAQAVPLIVLGCGGIALWRVTLVDGLGWRHVKHAGPRFTYPAPPWVRFSACAFCVGLAAVAVAGPVLSLLVRSLPLSTYGEMWKTAQEEMGWSFAVSGAATLIAMTLAVGLLMVEHYLKWTRAFVLLSIAAYLVSGPVLSLGLTAFWNHGDLRRLVYDTPAILVIACVARYMIFAHLGARIAFNSVHNDLFDNAQVLSPSWWRPWADIQIPLAGPALVATAGLVFMLSLGELDAVVALVPPGYNTVSARIFSLMHYGPSSLVAALCLFEIAVVIASFVGLSVFFNKVSKIEGY